jgi:hypothetical protein
MPEVIVLKPRRNNSPFQFNGVSYPQIVDELGVVRLEVEDPEFLTFMAENPDTFEVPAGVVPAPAPEAADETIPATAEEPVVAPEAAAEEPVAVVAAGEEPAAAKPLTPPKGGRKSRLNA